MGKAREQVVDKLNAYVDFDGLTLDRLAEEAETLKSMVVDAGGDTDSAFIDYEHYGYDGAFDVVVKYSRPETDKEYDRRQKLEAKAREKAKAYKQKKLDKEFAEFARLKKKFEKS